MTMSKYWRKREEENRKRLIKNNNKLMRELQRSHNDARREIQKEIEAFYGRYASKEGISMEVAKQRVTKLNIEDYSIKAKKYVKERRFTPTANEEMRLYNVTMRVNRLELLKKNIELELLSLYSGEERLMLDYFTTEALYEYERLSGILGVTVASRKKELSALINASFKNATWSTRLWNNQDALKTALNRELNRAMVQGLNSRDTARNIRDQFDVSVDNSERLMVTEQGRIRVGIQKDSYEQLGIDKYEVIVEPDGCDICKEFDGEIYDVKDMRISENAPIFHPRCMCSTASYIDRKDYEKDLKTRGL